MKNKVGNNADEEFRDCDDETADESSENERAGLERKIEKIKRAKNEAARQKHCPVGSFSENDFNEAIHYASGAKNDCVFDDASLI